VKYLDKALRKFVLLSILLISVMFFMLTVFGFVYRFSTINTYNFILLIFILMTILIILFYVISIISIFLVYRFKSQNRITGFIARQGIKTLLPMAIFFASILKTKKDLLRKFYIDFNNIIVSASGKCYSPENVLILLPHCLQNSDCGYKITNNADNCKRCGRCSIGDIVEVARSRRVEVKVVTGGTVARNIVKKLRPRLIIAVACERDLTSGIIDLGKVPVIGLINDRPNGPCYNTSINLDTLRTCLDKILNI